MSWVTGEITSGWTASQYPGFGILFENLSADGENGASPLLNDGGVPGDEVRWELISADGLEVIAFNEDGTAHTQGIGSYVYRSFIGNVAVDDFTVSIVPPGYNLTLEPAETLSVGTAVGFVRGYAATLHPASSISIGSGITFNRGYSVGLDAAVTVSVGTDIGFVKGHALTLHPAATTSIGSEIEFDYDVGGYSIDIDPAISASVGTDINFLRGYSATLVPATSRSRGSIVNFDYPGVDVLRLTKFTVKFKDSGISATFKDSGISATFN